MDIQLLEEIANAIDAKMLYSDLQILKTKVDTSSCLYLPIIGEFNAGKTTLLNSITGDSMLEVGDVPTTSTIFQIHFGSDKCFAEVHNADGSTRIVDDMSSLKNLSLSDIPVIDIYSTSNVLPSSVILVDTPGISSMINQHRRALMSCLPQADGVLLAADINKGSITKSLLDFVNETGVDKCRIDLILTHCESKSPKEIDDIVKYINNSNLPITRIVCSSINDIHEVIELLREIHENKDSILQKINNQRVQKIAKKLDERLTALLNSSNQDSSIDEEISKQERFLSNLNTQIRRLQNIATSKINSAKSDIEADFKKSVISRLDYLVANRNADYDAQGVNIINNAAVTATHSLRSSAKQIVLSTIRELQSDNMVIDSDGLEGIDFNEIAIGNFSSNLRLNGLGHEYDRQIASGIKVTAAIVAAFNGVGPVPINPSTRADDSDNEPIIGTVVEDSNVISEKVLTQSSMPSDPNIVPRQMASDIEKRLGVYDRYDHEAGERFGLQKGLVESMVGLVTDVAMAKPQRMKAIQDYYDNILFPEFRSQMDFNSQWIINTICSAIQERTKLSIFETKDILSKLQATQQQSAAEFESMMQKYQLYKNSLNSEFIC